MKKIKLILMMIIFEIFNFCFPELLDNLMISMELSMILLIINVIELKTIKKLNNDSKEVI